MRRTKTPIRWRPKAAKDAERSIEWWVKNRPRAPHLLVDELDRAIDLLGWSPEMGEPQENPKFRHIVLQLSRYLIYYHHDAVEGVIWIVGFQSTLLGSRPRFARRR